MAEEEEDEEEEKKKKKRKKKSLYSVGLTLLAGHYNQKVHSTRGRTDEGQGTREGRRGEEGRRKRPTVKTKITEEKLKRSLFVCSLLGQHHRNSFNSDLLFSSVRNSSVYDASSSTL